MLMTKEHIMLSYVPDPKIVTQVSATHINQRGLKNTDEFKSKKNLKNFKDQIGLRKFKVHLTKFQKEIEVKTPYN